MNFNRKPIEKPILEEMVKMQRHRGPDDLGLYYGDHFGLGHTRLSIIDLSPDAHQPMASEDASLYIIHNGEIYNYLELKEELKRHGHTFRSRSDTEIILHAYEEWGEGCLKYFNGMWAFAILDIKKQRLFCSRDRFGVKPLYYYIDDELFAFASEIKAILRHPHVQSRPNDQAIYDYLISGYGYMDISDHTFFRGIRQIKPAHYIILSIKERKFFQARYWDIDAGRMTEPKEEEAVYRNFYDLFRDSVRLRLRSDVPVGVSLSGGLDSSSISCVAAGLLGEKKLEVFSSCFDEEEYDERRFIRPVLERTNANANLIFTKSDNLFEEMERIVWHQEEPYSTMSIFPQWYVMKLAKEKGVKVLLTGQGGDEVLGGYHKYYFYLFADLVCSLKWLKAVKEMKLYKNFSAGDDSISNATFRIVLSYMFPRSLKHIFKNRLGASRPDYLSKDFMMAHTNTVFTERKFKSILNNDLYNALKASPLPSLLHIDDRSSMAHSVESRSPFLDYRLVEYLFSLGPEYKIRDGITKYVLRKSLRGILPKDVLNRRDKMGFTTPLDNWFRTILKDKVRDILSSREFGRRPYFNQSAILRRFERFADGREANGHYAVWSWVNLELWFRKFIDAK